MGLSVLLVETPGPLTTVQDLGRPGHRAYGVPPSGALDRFALSAANRLVGNQSGAPGLECVAAGPALRALRPCLLAVTGADFGATVNDEPAPDWTAIHLSEGDQLRFTGRRAGGRCYIALAGGIAADRWLGSAATYLLIARGGLLGRPLRAGDRLELSAEPPRPLVAGRHLPASRRPAYDAEVELLAIPGPHHSRLDRASRSLFWKQPFVVSQESDRMGFRLEGAELRLKGRDLLSLALTFGAVQVPPSGNPILLMADHQTAGGYPVVAGVARASLPLAAQLLPGDRLGFRQSTPAVALAAWRSLNEALESID
jgi:antagonist of KipI